MSSAVRFDIPPQQLPSALLKFSEQSGVTVTSPGDLVEGKNSPGVVGTFDARGALSQILTETSLGYEIVDNNTVLITSGGAKRGVPAQPGARSTAAGLATNAEEPQKNPSFWQRFRLAQTDSRQDVSGRSDGGESAGAPAPVTLEEVIVSAQKRTERLQDVPVPVTAISAQTLISNNQVQLKDYYTKVPGLNLTEGTYGGSIISIRGITSGVQNDNTTSVVVDDVPYGISSAVGPGEVVPELDPSELSRIEVLRGPQGTLYGASSMGGLLKYVTIDPSTESASGHLQVSVGDVRNGDQLGYSARGAVNVPLGDSIAIRASGFTRRDPGYIDDPVHGRDGVNWGTVSGGRVSGLWRLPGTFALKLTALYQESHTRGNSYVNLVPGASFEDLKQSTVPDSGGYRKKLQLYSANLTGEIGRASLTSVSAYSVSDNAFLFDATPLVGSVAKAVYGVTGAPSIQVENADKFTQEIRVALPLGSKVDWLAGVFYDHENIPQYQNIIAADFTTGAPAGPIAFFGLPADFEEYAAFTNLTFHMTDRFDLQVGGRGSQNEQSLTQTNIGPLFGGTFVRPQLRSKDSSVTYLVTPQFKVSPDLMVYARLASGYRPGGPNLNAALGAGAQPEYGPDKTLNYEIGIKGDAGNHLLTFDASVYRIDWQDMLINLRSPVGSYKANAGTAKSQGIDLALEVRPLRGLSVSGWVAWNDAELTGNFPATSTVAGFSGDRLPFSSRFSGSLSVDQEFPITSTLSGFAGASVSYVGERRGSFVGATATRDTFPSYAKADVLAGVRSGSWTASLFANNVTDRRGVVNGGTANLFTNASIYIQPRSVGLTFEKTFEAQ